MTSSVLILKPYRFESETFLNKKYTHLPHD